MASLDDQVVLVTGCSTGIGRALAEEFARRKHHIFATARRLDALDGLTGDKLEKLPIDVTDPRTISAAVTAIVERAGRIDILVNNAGVNLVGPLAEFPLDGMRRVLETNVTGLLAMCQAVFPHMAERRSGRIVNVGSVVGILPTPFAGAYCTSKAAVHMISEVLRMEVKPFGIDVVVVQPGGVKSNIATTAASDIARYSSETSRYRAVYSQIEKRARASQHRPMDANAFARVVVDAVTRERAPRIVRAGRGSRVYPALGKLPGRAIDRVMARQFPLDALRK